MKKVCLFTRAWWVEEMVCGSPVVVEGIQFLFVPLCSIGARRHRRRANSSGA